MHFFKPMNVAIKMIHIHISLNVSLWLHEQLLVYICRKFEVCSFCILFPKQFSK